MPVYKAPLRDMRFLIHELLNINEHSKSLPYFQNLDADIYDPILEEAARVCENVIFPLNQSGDQEGCHFKDGKVTTPKGFKEAYQQYIQGGWASLLADPEFGGQALPYLLQTLLNEMLVSSNVAFSLYTGLSLGAYEALSLHATDEIKKTYLPALVNGKWTSTMCLTEPHCGTDLGLLRTRAEPQADNSYKLTGTKIFITSGEHDLADNIIHLVLARLPDAPAGVKGISLFLVPKLMVKKDGTLGANNTLVCGSIEHKMGMKASATCVMNFEGATGYLIGEKHQGLKAMFSMMNQIRLLVGLQGLSLAETAYQNAVAYANDRLQGRSATGSQYPDKMADPIIVHPDIRKMLLTIKAFTEGSRALSCWIALRLDIAKHHPDAQVRAQADALIALLTPVFKGFLTDYGFDCCNLALQVFGGHGYIIDYGMEQLVRDARLAQIYEGTNGVQALDLVKRKLIGTDGKLIAGYVGIINKFIENNAGDQAMGEYITALKNAVKVLNEVSQWIMQATAKNPEEAGAASSDYLRLLGFVSLAFMWAQMIKVAQGKLKSGEDKDFYTAKIQTGHFYFLRVLPQIETLKHNIKSGSEVVMEMSAKNFSSAI